MGRVCIVCDKDLGSFVRQYSKEGKMPSTICKEIKKRFDIDIEYHQLRYHIKHHDMKAGTAIMAKRGADKQYAEANTLRAKSVEMLNDVQEHLAKLMSFQSLITSEEFEELPVDKKVMLINSSIKTMGDLKKIEIAQQRLDMDRNPALDDIHKLISGSNAMKSRGPKQQEVIDNQEEGDNAIN